jgi:hypothetical protein
VLAERLKRGIREGFGTAKNLLDFMLGVMTFNEASLFAKVQKKPEF